jgi:hypothetical protein
MRKHSGKRRNITAVRGDAKATDGIIVPSS